MGNWGWLYTVSGRVVSYFPVASDLEIVEGIRTFCFPTARDGKYIVLYIYRKRQRRLEERVIVKTCIFYEKESASSTAISLR